MRLAAAALALLCALPAFAQEKFESRELVGHMGSRTALLTLYLSRRSDTDWRVTGEYVLLPILVRRYLEGERTPERGFTTLKEGESAILFGHPATGELRGTYRDGAFKGTRYGPGGQEREQFEFSEQFPSMQGYSASVSCEAGDARYASKLEYVVESGTVKSLEWSSRALPGGQRCRIAGLEQMPMQGGLQLASGSCSVTLRDLGEAVKIAAENCTAACGSEAYFEPLLVDRHGSCRLLRPEEK